jgi:secretion/DNA translocation related TadE-like protein
VLLVATVVVLRTLAVLARHRAEADADLAALATAGQIGVSDRACVAAERIAARNGARLRSCHLTLDASGRSGTVVVRVTVAARLPVVGATEVTASARAGRLPA